MASASSASSSMTSTRIAVPLPGPSCPLLPVSPLPGGGRGLLARRRALDPSCLASQFHRGYALSPPAPAVRRPDVSGLVAADWGQAAGRRQAGRVLDRGRGRLAVALRYLGRDEVADLDRADARHPAGHPG